MKNSKDKIALFIPDLGGGGAQKMLVNLANEFSARGYRAELVPAKKKGPFLKDVRRGVNIRDLGAGRTLASLFPLIRYLKEEKPRLMFSSLTYANLVAIAAKIISMSKTVLIIREENYFSINATFAEKILTRALYKKADGIIAVSEGVRKDLLRSIKLEGKKVQAVYNPVITSGWTAEEKSPANHPFFKQGKSRVLLGAGRLEEQKDFKTLIKALAIVRRKIDAKLIIIGEGSKRKELEKLANELGLENALDMPGFTENPYTFMLHTDVFVLSSRFEGFGNVLVEAMACGTPVVSTDCPSGPAEILKNGKYGALVPVGGVEEMARAVIRTLENPPEGRFLRERAEEFSVEKAARKHLDFYFKIRSEKKGEEKN